MPMNRADYPENWEEISQRIRFERAGGRCECEGECGLHTERCTAEHGKRHPITNSMVVLTVAHLDHGTTDNSDANLRAMCQRCHLVYDAEQHAASRRASRREAALEAGQLEMAL